MTHNLTRTQRLIFHAIEKRFVIVRPHHIAGSILYIFGKHFPRFNFFDEDMILTTTHRIDTICNQFIIRTYAICADIKIMMTFCHFITVKENLFWIFHIIFTTAVNRIFLTFLITRIVIISVSFYRIRDVILFDASHDFII